MSPSRLVGAGRRALLPAITAGILASVAGASPALAWNVVTNTNGDSWAVNDAAIPGLDTGSIHNTTTNSLIGYGGIRMHVNGGSDRLDGILLRGFGLRFDGIDAFSSTSSPATDGISVQRALLFDKAGDWARFFDSFTNTTRTTVTVEVAFGGQLGYKTGSNQSAIATTSSGDAMISSADSWASFYTPSAGPGSASFNGPSATVIGSPAPFVGGLNRMGNFLRDPFDNPLATSGDEANHYGFVNRLVIPPKQTRSLAHFVVTGLSETRVPPGGGPVPAAGTQVAAVQAGADALATTPPLSDLSTGQICTIANWNLAAISVPGFSSSSCPATQGEPTVGPVTGVAEPPPVTSSPYDVTGKTITELAADMAAGRTTAQQIVRAYMDRIVAYDQGPLGLHAVLDVAPDAMAQAKSADAARAAGDRRPLLGIPILAKDIFDTRDMPTTGGSLVFDGYRPTKDAWIVAKLREAGAIILGKANLAEFATDGHFSPSAYGQVWNAFDPSRSSIGSSGGSAVAVASSFAAAALGTQTGDSLWGPSSAASLSSLRGTDGMQSTDGVMPLTYVQDYAGVIARSIPDLALLLNATAIGNPGDPLDDVSDGHRPADWTAALSAGALQGKVIGVPASAFNDPFGGTGTSDAMRAQFAHFTEAGATVKPIPDPPAAPPGTPGDKGYEGWLTWIQGHPDNPYTEVPQIIRSPLRIPQFRNTAPYAGTGPMTDIEIKAFQDFRAAYRTSLAQWMDTAGVDAAVFPGELSDIHLNDSIQPSFGRLDPQASAAGVPTVIFPAGLNDHGQPINLQLEGRAFSDPQLLAYAAAFEAKANGHVGPTTTPPLRYEPGVEVAPVTTVPTPAPSPITTPPATMPPALSEANPPPAVSYRRLTLLHGSLKSDGKGRFKVLVGCASEARSCTGTVVVRRSGALLVSRTVTVKAGLSITVTVTAPAGARHSLARHHKLKFTVALQGSGGTLSTKAAAISVRRG
ncbi:MAG: amidase [Solirubrobacteraceae bacterium]|nr:amidase [Solirubrobacteraceae bacterium]